MNPSTIRSFISVFIALFISPKFKIIENYYVSQHGYDIDKVHNLHTLCSVITTIIICFIVYMLLKLFELVFSYFRHKNIDH